MYSYKDEQKKIDVKKWNESAESGADKCGTYSFCALCQREQEYPCAKAKRRESNQKGKIRVAVAKAR